VTKSRRGKQLTAGQRRARDEFRRIAADRPDSLTIVADDAVDRSGALQVTIRLPTRDLPAVDGGFPLADHEDITVDVSPGFPLGAPAASVNHQRFAGHPHVLQGERLCIYLDPAREWHPAQGIAGFLERLWQWLGDGAAARFDATTALYHPVGGVLHQSPGTPTIVIRDSFTPGGKAFTRAYLTTRSPKRLDLTWTRSAGRDAHAAPVIVLPAPLQFGAGATVAELLAAISQVGQPTPENVLAILATSAQRNPQGSVLHFLLAVPNLRSGDHHLIAGRLPSALADHLRQAAHQQGPLVRIPPAAIPADLPIEWCAMSDERPEITTRRDHQRPTSAFAGKTIHIWGCGGLGSWIAEFIARAGAAKIVLCDPAPVTRGLLVRQNYTEPDIGHHKVDALAVRLRAINDQLCVSTSARPLPAGTISPLPDCDAIIDATINLSLGVLLDAETTRHPTQHQRPLIAQVATDTRTGTLGLLTVAAPDYPGGPALIDQSTGDIVLEDGQLERFHTFWQTLATGDEIVPARGCSTPTFHGSAADLAAVAATLVSLLGPHLQVMASGTHLIALPHAGGDGPTHHFVPAPPRRAGATTG
jgi:ThiF family/Prokaryotic E2 family A